MTYLPHAAETLLDMIGTLKTLTVHSANLKDDEYGTGDILADLKHLYTDQKQIGRVQKLLLALLNQANLYDCAVGDRIDVLNGMLRMRLGAI